MLSVPGNGGSLPGAVRGRIRRGERKSDRERAAGRQRRGTSSCRWPRAQPRRVELRPGWPRALPGPPAPPASAAPVRPTLWAIFKILEWEESAGGYQSGLRGSREFLKAFQSEKRRKSVPASAGFELEGVSWEHPVFSGSCSKAETFRGSWASGGGGGGRRDSEGGTGERGRECARVCVCRGGGARGDLGASVKRAQDGSAWRGRPNQ